MAMDPTVQATIAGGTIALLASVITVLGGHAATRRRQDRDDIRKVAAQFLSACDRLWSAELSVRMAVFTMMNLDRRSNAGAEERRQADEARLHAFEDHRTANWDARRSRDQMTLLTPKLDAVSDELYGACNLKRGNTPSPLPTDEEKSRHDAARESFLAAARRAAR